MEFSVGTVHRSDQSALQLRFAAAALFVRSGLHARVLPESSELFQPGVLVVFEPVRAERFPEDAGCLSYSATGQRSECPVHDGRGSGQHLVSGAASFAVFHQRQFGLESGIARDQGWYEYPGLPIE